MFYSQWYGRFVRKYNVPFLFVSSFLMGCAAEFTMICWSPGGTNFYNTFIEKESKKAALKILEKEQKGLF